ncbi:hypothetical protein G6F56_004505 [Rhizopus delemar]|nr:hypothetical protein G6F56_004505 [Rhizopus delemar]
MGIHKRVTAKKSFLSEQHRKARLRFAKDYKDWTLELWRKVIWTNECSIGFGKKNMSTSKIWRKSWERYRKGRLRPTFKSGITTVMVWGSITYGKKTGLTIIPKKKRSSADFVKNVYEPAMFNFYNSIDGATLMKDNAPIHTASAAKEWNYNGLLNLQIPI